jgi:mannose-6-phosphate isomerase-like protein (cupin superfamily)
MSEAIWFLDTLMIPQVTGEESDGAFCLAEQYLPAGHVTPLHVQPHEDETFHVLDGRLTVHLDGREVTAGAAETVLVRRGTPHALRADSATRLLVLDVPAGHDRFFLAVGRPAAERRLPDPLEGPPDFEAMAAAARDARFEILGPPPFG